MSNLLVENGYYNGIIIKTDKMSEKSEAEERICLSCGVRLAHALHRKAVVGLGGMEGLVGVPGSVGGMVKQNAGAFGYEISDRFISADCYLLNERKVVTFSKDDMKFSYRSSALRDRNAVLLSATFELLPMRVDDINEKIRSYSIQRRRTQPLEYPSLGSVFKRYNGHSAGFYIDRAELKGAFVGGAAVSEKHAGFIVNKGGATSGDFLELIKRVKNKVYADFGIELEEEIEII